MDQAARDALRALAGIKPAPKGAPGVLKSVFEGIPTDKNDLRKMAGLPVKEDTTTPVTVQPVSVPPAAPMAAAPSSVHEVTDLDKIEKLLNEALTLLNNLKKAK